MLYVTPIVLMLGTLEASTTTNSSKLSNCMHKKVIVLFSITVVMLNNL